MNIDWFVIVGIPLIAICLGAWTFMFMLECWGLIKGIHHYIKRR